MIGPLPPSFVIWLTSSMLVLLSAASAIRSARRAMMDARHYARVPTIARLAERIAEAADRSTNIELVNQITKLGGNGPIMANALAGFGMKVTYLGNLGYPHLHPVFHEFARRAEVYSIAEPGHTDALEFEDGKRSEEHTSELQSRLHLVCRLLLEKKKKKSTIRLHLL